MAQSLRSAPYRLVSELAVADYPCRNQSLPFIIYRLFRFLTTSTSLTQLLRQELGSIEIHKLSFSFQAEHQLWWRDVEIRAHNVLQWSARTIIWGDANAARIWGQGQFLGDLIFNSNHIHRQSLRIEQVRERLVGGTDKRAWYWLRRSVWIMQTKDLGFEILEFF